MPPVFAEKLFGTILGTFFRASDKSTAFNNTPDIENKLTVTSEQFEDNSTMPFEFGGEGVGKDSSVQLSVSNLPEQTKSLVLIIQDVDVPLPSPIVHLSAYNIDPLAKNFEVGHFNSGKEKNQKVTFGKGGMGKVGYIGPKPIVNDGPHRYIHQFFALGEMEPLAPHLEYKQVLEAINKHGLAKGQLTGSFERTDAKH